MPLTLLATHSTTTIGVWFITIAVVAVTIGFSAGFLVSRRRLEMSHGSSLGATTSSETDDNCNQGCREEMRILATDVAHDVNNLLTPIVANAEMLAERDLAGDNQMDLAAEIRDIALEGRNIVDGLLLRVGPNHDDEPLRPNSYRPANASRLVDASTRRRVLLVDDEDLPRTVITTMIRSLGHRVDAVASAEAALDLFDEFDYDLVVTDYAMPAMNGDELASAIAARAPGQPVLMITGFLESQLPPSQDRVVLTKPVTFDMMRSTIDGLLPERHDR